MKHLFIYIGIVLFAANILITILMSSPIVVVITSCAVILTTFALCYISGVLHMKDALKFSTPIILLLSGVVEWVLSFFTASENGNYCISAIIILFACQIILLLTYKTISNHD